MRNEYDMIIDTRVEKSSRIFNKRVLISLIAVMAFIVSCGIFLKTTYLYAMQQIEFQEKKEDDAVSNKNNSSRKTYYIEQRLRKDLEKILQQGK